MGSHWEAGIGNDTSADSARYSIIKSKEVEKINR